MPKEEQEDEIQVLQAVYLREFVDLRQKDAWKVWRPPEIMITLYPSNSDSANLNDGVSLDMHVKLSEKYPHELPSIKFINPHNVSQNDIKKLLEKVNTLTNSLKGQVMIMDICLHVQEYLRETVVRKNSTNLRFKSFHEGMLRHQMQQEIELKDAQEKLQAAEIEKQTNDWQKIENELQKRNEERRQDLLKRKQQHNDRLDNRDDDICPTTISNENSSSRDHVTNNGPFKREESLKNDKNFSGSKVKLLLNNGSLEKTVIITRFVGSCHKYNVSYECFAEDTNETMNVSEWNLKWLKKCSNPTYLQREIQTIEKEFQSLVKIEHSNLMKYISLSVRQNVTCTSFYLIKTYIHRAIPVCLFYERKLPVSMLYAQQLSRDILQALDYLHSKGIVHKDISLDCIYDLGNQFLLSDFSIRKKLLDLCDFFANTNCCINTFDQIVDFSTFSNVESRRNFYGMGKMGQKLDIFTFGVCLTMLASGSPIEDNALFKIPDDLPHDFRNFVQKMTNRNEEERWSAAQLLKHHFLQPSDGSHGKKAPSPQDNPFSDKSVEENVVPLLAVSPQWNRLESEFDVLKFLGRGGFGDVLKVRNKLDGCVYAIKRIVLNPSKKEENRKITREVKLLSRLNHENVVRYYNSWIERGLELPPDSERTSSSIFTDKPMPQTCINGVNNAKKNVSFGLGALNDEDIEKLAPPPTTDSAVEWSVSLSRGDLKDPSSGDSDSSDEDGPGGRQDDRDDDVFGNLFFDTRRRASSSDSDDVVFGNNGAAGDNEEDSSAPAASTPSVTSIQKNDNNEEVEQQRKNDNNDVFVQILYIQMEFCEKSTLRQIIDDGELYSDHQRAWKLFREIVEGLAYIHKQGMIHRDLKPVNIFLDSNDHAKIGDFGLATHGGFLNQLTDFSIQSDVYKSAGYSPDGAKPDNEFTTKIGTALYIAPELCAVSGKKPYTQHVDIYSLGIILFEIFYRPLGTGMERVKIITDLRKPDVLIPQDFSSNPTCKNQVKLLHWLLQHEAEKRPSADQLLRSDFFPPIEMQQSDFQLAVSNALADTQTRQFKWLIGTVMNQQPSTVQDYVYDSDMYKGSFFVRDALAKRYVIEKLQKIFSIHGIVQVNTPLLLPKSKILTENVDSRVDVMDESGLLLHLPYDLHIPFARYAVRNNLVHFKRYCINTVYRNPGRLESHPREITECAVDIVTSQNCCAASTAELLTILSDVVFEFPALHDRNFLIKINNTLITKAILMHCGVEKPDHQEKLMSLLVDVCARKIGKQKRDQKLRQDLNLSEKMITNLFDLLEIEDSFSKVASKLRLVTKRESSQGSSLAKEGLHELEVILNNCEAFGVRLPIVVSPKLLFSLHEYEGTIFQVVCHHKVKGSKETRSNVFAAGGRYDSLLEKFRKPVLYKSSVQHNTAAVGLSIAFDAILSVVSPPKLCQYDVLVCSVGRKLMLKEKLRLARSLWKIGVKTDYIQEPVQNLEDLQDFCRKNSVDYLLVFKDSESAGVIRVKSWENDKCTEKKLSIFDVPAYLQEKFSSMTPKNEIGELTTPQNKAHNIETAGCAQSLPSSTSSGAANLSNVKVHFVMNEKLALNARRRYEFQMSAAIGPLVRRFSNRETIDVILTDLPGPVVKNLAAFLDCSDETTFHDSSRDIFLKFNKHKQQLSALVEELWKLKIDSNEAATVLLYSCSDDTYRFIL